MSELLPIERIENKIFLIRGQKVMLDSDLADLYGVRTKELNKAVARNIGRFPDDFMFKLILHEYEELRFHFGTSNIRSQFVPLKRGGRRYLPYAFTENGVAMLSSVLHSERAIQVNIAIMRAFTRLRTMLASHKEILDKFRELEGRVDGHDSAILQIVDEIKRIIAFEEKPKKRIGFRPNE
ncbi:MAG: ORF6N domain-containing protein [Candidatus Margulisbacteria bacterium]|nr:ORF6N domain-containing protein [Candidatus Margulisiibacteriota bacterium]